MFKSIVMQSRLRLVYYSRFQAMVKALTEIECGPITKIKLETTFPPVILF